MKMKDNSDFTVLTIKTSKRLIDAYRSLALSQSFRKTDIITDINTKYFNKLISNNEDLNLDYLSTIDKYGQHHATPHYIGLCIKPEIVYEWLIKNGVMCILADKGSVNKTVEIHERSVFIDKIFLSPLYDEHFKNILIDSAKEINYEKDICSFFKSVGLLKKLYERNKDNEEFSDSIDEIFGNNSLKMFEEIFNSYEEK